MKRRFRVWGDGHEADARTYDFAEPIVDDDPLAAAEMFANDTTLHAEVSDLSAMDLLVQCDEKPPTKIRVTPLVYVQWQAKERR